MRMTTVSASVLTEHRNNLKATTKFVCRAPKAIAEERHCAECGMKLNRYHKGDRCYLHEERKVPRLRGHKVKEGD